MGTNRAVFLDRDGTINVDTGYFHEAEKLELLPNVIEGLKLIQNMNFKLIIISNQSGIGRGYFVEEDTHDVNNKLIRILKKENIFLEKVYFCPHNVDVGCDCRKPEIALIKKAKNELNINLSESYMIGDTSSDIEAGINAGCKTIRVTTGKSISDKDTSPNYLAKDLLDAANFILKEEKSS